MPVADWETIKLVSRAKSTLRENCFALSGLLPVTAVDFTETRCVERIFNDILRFCQPEQISVYARYTRRGRLDGNPRRSNTDLIARHGAGWRDNGT